MTIPLLSLDVDVLVSVFHKLDPVSLACLSCCCKALRAIADRDDLWQPLCRDRWHNLGRDTEPQGRTFQKDGVATALAPPDWHSIYISQNGWRAPSAFKAARFWNSRDPGEIYTLLSCTASDLGLESSNRQIAIAGSQPYEDPPRVEIHDLASPTSTSSYAIVPGGTAASSLTVLSGGRFAAGTQDGR